MLAAYVFAFLEFPCKTLMFIVVIGTLLLPIEVTLIANVETIRDLGWFNSSRACRCRSSPPRSASS